MQVKDDENTKKLRESSAALVQNLVNGRPEMRLAINKDDLVGIGKKLWPMTYKGATDDTEAFERYCAMAKTMVDGLKSNHEEERISGTLGAAMLFLPMEQMTYFWSCRWADQAFPTITMGHKYAAALMSTSISPDLVSEVIPPFNAFMIEVPDKLLEIEDPNAGLTVSARYIIAQYVRMTSGDYTWNYVVLTDGSLTIWRHGVPTTALAEEDPETITTWDEYSFALKSTDRDERIHIMVGRLLTGVCLALSSKDSSKPIGKNHGTSAAVLRASSEPLVRTFQLGRPIKIDCRQSVKDYVAGVSSSAPGVQKLLRGHWQRYHHGPKGNSTPRWHHKEPYWRGPEDAPILVRPMDLQRVDG